MKRTTPITHNTIPKNLHGGFKKSTVQGKASWQEQEFKAFVAESCAAHTAEDHRS